MLEAIAKRQSIRRYTNKKVSKKDLTDLLKAAMRAPSACNSQNWYFLVSQNKQDLLTVSEIKGYYSMCKEASAIIVAMADTTDKYAQFSEVNVAAAIENILLEATNKGIGTCWCAIHPSKTRIKAFREYFNIDSKYLPIACIAIGYPNEEKPIKNRFDKNKIEWR